VKQKIIPFEDRLLLQALPAPDEPTLFIEDPMHKPRFGKVLDVGIGAPVDGGTRGYVPMGFQKGDIVLYNPSQAFRFVHEGQELVLICLCEILGRFA